jgi:hypothetical protein
VPRFAGASTSEIVIGLDDTELTHLEVNAADVVEIRQSGTPGTSSGFGDPAVR